jgi:hypothetical protein
LSTLALILSPLFLFDFPASFLEGVLVFGHEFLCVGEYCIPESRARRRALCTAPRSMSIRHYLDAKSSRWLARATRLVAAAPAAAAATATAIAAATTTTPAAATAAAATTAAPLFAWASFVDREGATVVLLQIKAFDSGCRFSIAGHFDEAETFATTGVAVHDDFGALHSAIFREQLLQIRT